VTDNPLNFNAALITGASSGLGRALSLWFAGRGVRVYAAARRRDHLISLRNEAPTGLIEPVQLDITQTEETIAAIRAIDDACRLDLVIANAGVSNRAHASGLSWQEVEHTLKVNILGAAATLVALVPRMTERRRGALAGVASIAGLRGLPKHAAYTGSKAFLMNFMESLRIDLQPFGVTVTCALPGFFKSEITAKNRFHMPLMLEADQAAERIARAIICGKPTVQFPWQLAWLARTGRLFPSQLYDMLVRRFP